MKCDKCGGRVIFDKEHYCEMCGLTIGIECFEDTIESTTNAMRADNGLTTEITKSQYPKHKEIQLRRTHARYLLTPSEKTMNKNISELKRWCTKFELNEDEIKNCVVIFKNLKKKYEAVENKKLFFVIIVLSCRKIKKYINQEYVMSEMGIKEKRATRKLLREININLKIPPLSVRDYINYICGNLNLSMDVRKRAIEFCEDKENWETQLLLASCAVYIFSGDNIPQKKIADLMGIPEYSMTYFKSRNNIPQSIYI